MLFQTKHSGDRAKDFSFPPTPTSIRNGSVGCQRSIRMHLLGLDGILMRLGDNHIWISHSLWVAGEGRCRKKHTNKQSFGFLLSPMPQVCSLVLLAGPPRSTPCFLSSPLRWTARAQITHAHSHPLSPSYFGSPLPLSWDPRNLNNGQRALLMSCSLWTQGNLLSLSIICLY